nr:RES domain-containing protein [Phenylobacterium sp.]
MTIRAYEVDCADVIDLADVDTRSGHGVTHADLACPWEDLASRGIEPPSWRVAGALIASGAAALVAPSFAPGTGPADRNLVFWKWSDAPPYKVTVIDDEARLSREGRSWETG